MSTFRFNLISDDIRRINKTQINITNIINEIAYLIKQQSIMVNEVNERITKLELKIDELQNHITPHSGYLDAKDHFISNLSTENMEI